MKPSEAQTPEERLAIAQQRLDYERQRLEAETKRTIRLLRGLRYLIYGQSVMIALWILANHFWR
jgi:hypothetical protein